jgi:hypothetical protein
VLLIVLFLTILAVGIIHTKTFDYAERRGHLVAWTVCWYVAECAAFASLCVFGGVPLIVLVLFFLVMLINTAITKDMLDTFRSLRRRDRS